MDSRLQRVGGTRPAHLRKSDAPRVAQAIVDAIGGKARILSGMSHDIMYLEFVKDKSYTVVVRGDDWRKIFPFFRYSSKSYNPVIPPPNEPPPIMSPQPNRTMKQPPENPAGGLRSFLACFPFDEYSKLQKLLSMLSLDDLDKSKPVYKDSDPTPSDGIEWLPPQQRTDSASSDAALYNQLVKVLQQLFPIDYPTTY